MKTFFTRNRLYTALGIFVLLLLWEVASVLADSSELVPGPEETLVEFGRTVTTSTSLYDIGATLARGIIGFMLAFLLALVLGLVAGGRPAFDATFQPLLVVMRATPVVSFILLLLIWLRTEWVPIMIAFITMFPVMYTNIRQGMVSVDTSFREMARVYRLPVAERLRSLYLPSVAAFLFSGMATALGFGWRAIIIGEVLSQPPRGIGSRLREAYAYFDVVHVIGWTACAVLISYLFEWLLSAIEKRSLRWKRS